MFAPRLLTSVLVLTWVAAAPASAATIATYSTSSSFNLATNGLFAVNTAINFEAHSCFNCTTFTDSGVTFTGAGNSTPLTVGTVSGWGSGNVLKRTTGLGSISATVATNTFYAFSVSIVSVAVISSGFPLEINFTSGGAAHYDLSSASVGNAIFFGATSDAPITNLQFVSDANQLTIGADDLTLYTQIAAVPEASTLLLIGTGLFVIGLYRQHAGAALMSLLRRRVPLVSAAGCPISRDAPSAQALN